MWEGYYAAIFNQLFLPFVFYFASLFVAFLGVVEREGTHFLEMRSSIAVIVAAIVDRSQLQLHCHQSVGCMHRTAAAPIHSEG